MPALGLSPLGWSSRSHRLSSILGTPGLLPLLCPGTPGTAPAESLPSPPLSPAHRKGASVPAPWRTGTGEGAQSSPVSRPWLRSPATPTVPRALPYPEPCMHPLPSSWVRGVPPHREEPFSGRSHVLRSKTPAEEPFLADTGISRPSWGYGDRSWRARRQALPGALQELSEPAALDGNLLEHCSQQSL